MGLLFFFLSFNILLFFLFLLTGKHSCFIIKKEKNIILVIQDLKFFYSNNYL